MSATPAQSRQIKQQLATPEESLSYELGKAVQELPPLYTRLLAGAIGVLTVGTIAWANFSKVEEVAVTQGKLLPSTEVRPIRATSVGGVSETLVKEGDKVTKDQVLVEMHPGSVETSVESLEKEVEKLRQAVARLEAESTGSVVGVTPEQSQLLAARKLDLQTRQQSAISEANRQVAVMNEAQTQLERFQGNLERARITRRNAVETRDEARANLAITKERQTRLKSLEDSGAVPHLEILNAAAAVNQSEQQLVAARNQINEADNQIVTLEKQIQASRDRMQQAQQAFNGAKSNAANVAPQRQSEVLAQLAQRRAELSRKVGELEVAKKQKSDRATVKAPFDGTVYNLKVTQGPVQQGEELLSILPKDQELIMEVKVQNRDVGFVRLNQKAKVKLAAFPYQQFRVIEGKLISVSPDAVVERDANGREMGPVFTAKIQLDRSTVQVRGKDVELTPGMTGTADIVTRKKTVLSFLIEPITRKFGEAFSIR
ncbi:HlyD family efflux transporter periplasmic adaptor subunit [Romeriopsis navalis]|nr:HlyD family efflux transporter periplasmic adaptor subunit [Romeriopsis navalis]